MPVAMASWGNDISLYLVVAKICASWLPSILSDFGTRFPDHDVSDRPLGW